MSGDDNPYRPPNSLVAKRIDTDSKASFGVRVLFAFLAIGFMFASLFVKLTPRPMGFLGPSILFVLVVFQCAHVAIVGRWFVPRLSRR